MACSLNARADVPLRAVEFADLQRHNAYEMRAAREHKRSEQVTFALDGEPERAGERVLLGGWISNASPEPQLVVIFPVGNIGFLVQPVPGTVSKRLGPPMPPPAPPPPLAVTIPAMSRVKVQSTFYLTDWEWKTDVPREIEWSFQFWNDPKPHGRFMIP
jgi:hypothetical protein